MPPAGLGTLFVGLLLIVLAFVIPSASQAVFGVMSLC